MIYIQCFLLTSLISFTGSIQVGPVNVAVAYTTLQKNRQEAFLVALGGALPEAFYATLAVKGADLIFQMPHLVHYLSWICIPLFIGMGLHLLRNRYKPAVSKGKYGIHSSFLKGLALGIFNPLLLTYWVSVLVILKTYQLVFTEGTLLPLLFITGTSFGAFLFLLLVVWGFHRTKGKISLDKLHPITGIIFFILALVQIFHTRYELLFYLEKYIF